MVYMVEILLSALIYPNAVYVDYSYDTSNRLTTFSIARF